MHGGRRGSRHSEWSSANRDGGRTNMCRDGGGDGGRSWYTGRGRDWGVSRGAGRDALRCSRDICRDEEGKKGRRVGCMDGE